MKENKFFKFFKVEAKLPTLIVYIALRVIVVAALIANLLKGNYENVFVCFLTLILFVLPFFIEHKFKVTLPTPLQILILIFIFSAEILGEIGSFYTKFAHWDTILHTVNGFVMAAIGFSLINLFNDNGKGYMHLNPFFVVLVSFCFSMTTGAMWELFEYGIDVTLGKDSQKDTIVEVINSTKLGEKNNVGSVKIDSVVINNEEWEGYIDIGLIDTMEDLLVNFIGAIVFEIFGYFYLVKRKHKSIEKMFITRRLERIGENNG